MCKICEAMDENAARPTPAPYDAGDAFLLLKHYIAYLLEEIKRRKEEKERAGQTSLF